MGKFLKSGKVVLVLAGKFAGRKAVIVKSYDDDCKDEGLEDKYTKAQISKAIIKMLKAADDDMSRDISKEEFKDYFADFFKDVDQGFKDVDKAATGKHSGKVSRMELYMYITKKKDNECP